MKRKIESDDDIDDIDDESFDFGDQNKVLRTPKVKIKLPTSVSNQPWVEMYQPKSVNEVAINPSKLKQLKEKMVGMLENSSPRVLVVTGPSGCGKSTVVKLISKEISNGFVEYNETEDFNEFLNDCKYLIDNAKRFVVVENLPNVFYSETLRRFRQSIENWLFVDQDLPPLVICVTEFEKKFNENNNEFFNIENNFNINTIFGKNILFYRNIEVLKFNSVAKRFLTKPLKQITTKEMVFQKIPQNKINAFLDIVVESGDIRLSINNLEIWGKFFSKGLDLTNDFKKDAAIDLFHAIGKIIYSSTDYRDLDKTEQLNSNINDILKKYENLQLLNLSVLENYSNFINEKDFETMEFISDRLSESELIYKLDEGKDIMIRSTRVGLDENLTSHKKFGSINFTKNFNMIKEANKVKGIIHQLKYSPNFQTSFHNINLIDGFYVPIILNKLQYKNYDRIGGKFKYLSDNLFEDESSQQLEFKIDIKTDTVDDEGELSDPIEDSDDDFHLTNNDNDRKPLPHESDYEFLDDSEFM